MDIEKRGTTLRKRVSRIALLYYGPNFKGCVLFGATQDVKDEIPNCQVCTQEEIDTIYGEFLKESFSPFQLDSVKEVLIENLQTLLAPYNCSSYQQEFLDCNCYIFGGSMCLKNFKMFHFDLAHSVSEYGARMAFIFILILHGQY